MNLDSIHDLNQRYALEVQIMEFGQIPKQIFTVPHPQRLTGLPPLMPTKSRDIDDPVTAAVSLGMLLSFPDSKKLRLVNSFTRKN